MNSLRKGMFAFTAVVALSMPGLACDNTARGAREDAAEAQREADKKAQDAREKARAEANDASRTTSDATPNVGAAGETMDVKAALMADDTVDASGINVDTYAETRTVVLRGNVTTAAQKDLAGRIAAKEAEGYKVDNQLVVKPRR
ncbi:MAG: BON domain-containing protein [Acidobacteria bacterium]|nr:BON domain-containing protein [Acidobacteriota bacterium]